MNIEEEKEKEKEDAMPVPVSGRRTRRGLAALVLTGLALTGALAWGGS
jgi:hypothetical protein